MVYCKQKTINLIEPNIYMDIFRWFFTNLFDVNLIEQELLTLLQYLSSASDF